MISVPSLCIKGWTRPVADNSTFIQRTEEELVNYYEIQKTDTVSRGTLINKLLWWIDKIHHNNWIFHNYFRIIFIYLIYYIVTLSWSMHLCTYNWYPKAIFTTQYRNAFITIFTIKMVISDKKWYGKKAFDNSIGDNRYFIAASLLRCILWSEYGV